MKIAFLICFCAILVIQFFSLRNLIKQKNLHKEWAQKNLRLQEKLNKMMESMK